MPKRNIIEIDREKCIGCGQCAAACHQGAIAMVDGRAKLVRQDHCDGLGVCLGECPAGAIEIIEVEDDVVVQVETTDHGAHHGGGCPGHKQQVFKRPALEGLATGESALEGWPIQLHLIRPESPNFQGADVLIAASCSAFACGSFHADLLAGRALIIACPKLDRQEGYMEKLTHLFRNAKPRSVTVARMEVPCCRGLTAMVTQARDVAGADTPVVETVIGLQGEIVSKNDLARGAQPANGSLPLI